MEWLNDARTVRNSGDQFILSLAINAIVAQVIMRNGCHKSVAAWYIRIAFLLLMSNMETLGEVWSKSADVTEKKSP